MYIIKTLPGLIITCLCFSSFFPSCNTEKNLPYFKDVSDTTKPFLVKTIPFKNPVIKVDDVLAVTIQTLDNNITASINATNVSGSTGQQMATGYLVDKNGDIELPFAGKIKVEGLTTLEAKEVIRKEVDKYFNSPLVDVRFANFKITVLGEVARPASYIVPNQKINLFDALGLAGDLTLYGRRENVLLVRDSLDDKLLVRMNLNSKDIISSPYFYLKPNDIIYVEPSKYAVAQSESVRNRNNTAIITSTISLLIVLVTLFTSNN